MVLNEVIAELKSSNKIYYSAGMTQPYFSEMIRKISNGQCKPGTVKKFLGKFGYVIEHEEQWQKTSI